MPFEPDFDVAWLKDMKQRASDYVISHEDTLSDVWQAAAEMEDVCRKRLAKIQSVGESTPDNEP